MVIDEKLRTVLVQLRKIGAKVTGSLARGEENEQSDIDLYIPDSCDDKKWKAASEVMRATGWRLHSPFIMCLSTRDSSTMLEISCLFDPIPKDKRLPEVILGGIPFKTW